MKSSPIPTSRPADRLPRDRRIDLCYVIGILLVVAGHSGVDSRFASTALFRWIYAFHMPLFFALSGYLFRYGGGSGQVGAGTFARRRALRLLLPLVVWTTLVFIPKGLLSAYAMRPSELSFSAYLHAFLYPADNPIRPFWFLEVLFEVSLAGYAVDRIVRSRAAALAAVAGTCIAANRLIAPSGRRAADAARRTVVYRLFPAGSRRLRRPHVAVAAAGPPLVARFLGCGVARDASVPVARRRTVLSAAGILSSPVYGAGCRPQAAPAARGRSCAGIPYRVPPHSTRSPRPLLIGLLRGLLYPRLAVDPALFSARCSSQSGVSFTSGHGTCLKLRRWISSWLFSAPGGRLSLRLLGL